MRPPPPPSSRRPPPLTDEQPAHVPDSLIPVRLADLVDGPPTDRLYPPPPPGLAQAPLPSANLVHPPPPADLVEAATKTPESSPRKSRTRFLKTPTFGAFVAGAIIVLGARATFFAPRMRETPPTPGRAVIAPKPVIVVSKPPTTTRKLDVPAVEPAATIAALAPSEAPQPSPPVAASVSEPKSSAVTAPIEAKASATAAPSVPKPSATTTGAAIAAKSPAPGAAKSKPSTPAAASATNPFAPAAVFEWKVAQGSSEPSRALTPRAKRSSAKGSEPYKPPTASFPID